MPGKHQQQAEKKELTPDEVLDNLRRLNALTGGKEVLT